MISEVNVDRVDDTAVSVEAREGVCEQARLSILTGSAMLSKQPALNYAEDATEKRQMEESGINHGDARGLLCP
jgi:hypothetical protein